MRSLQQTIKLRTDGVRRENYYRPLSQSSEVNIKTVVEDSKYSSLKVAGVDVGIKNILTASYIKDGELRQQSFGTLPAWLFNHSSNCVITKLCREGRSKDWKDKHPLGLAVRHAGEFKGTMKAAAAMRNVFVMEASQIVAKQLVSVVRDSGAEYIALEHNMYQLRVAQSVAAKQLYEQQMLSAETLSTDMLYRTVVTALCNEAERAGIETIQVDARNTSRLCCKCGGWINMEDVRNARYFVKCDTCGTIWPRDLNASANILIRGVQTIYSRRSKSPKKYNG